MSENMTRNQRESTRMDEGERERETRTEERFRDRDNGSRCYSLYRSSFEPEQSDVIFFKRTRTLEKARRRQQASEARTLRGGLLRPFIYSCVHISCGRPI